MYLGQTVYYWRMKVAGTNDAGHFTDTINIEDKPRYEISDTNQDGKWNLYLNLALRKQTITSPYTRGQLHAGGESTHDQNNMNGEFKDLKYAEIVSGSLVWRLWDQGFLVENNPPYDAAWCTSPYHFRFATGGPGTCML